MYKNFELLSWIIDFLISRVDRLPPLSTYLRVNSTNVDCQKSSGYNSSNISNGFKGSTPNGASEPHDGPPTKLLLPPAPAAHHHLHPERERELQHHRDEKQLRQIRCIAAA